MNATPPPLNGGGGDSICADLALSRGGGMAALSPFVAADGDGYELQMGRWGRPPAPPFIRFSRISAAATWDTRGGLVFFRMFFDTAALLDPQANERRARVYTRPMTRPGELESAWRAAGLENIEAGTLTIRMEFSSFSDFWTPMEGKD